MIPAAVATELKNPASPSAVRDWLSRAPAWIKVAAVAPEDIGAIPDVLRRLRATNFYVDEMLLQTVFSEWL